MRAHPYERAWMWAASVMIGLGVGTILYGSFVQASSPPSHIETIDPAKVMTDGRFSQPGVTLAADGSATVTAVALMFAFMPRDIHVPAGKPVTFRLATPDVIHGFQIVGTNANALVVPGYVTEFTTTFAPGDYLIVCNEFCGVGHHIMQGRVIAGVAP